MNERTPYRRIGSPGGSSAGEPTADAPPSVSRGAKCASVRVDWLRMSGPRGRWEDAVRLLRGRLGEPERGPGRCFLPDGWRWGGGSGVYYDACEDGASHCVVELSAGALSCFAERGVLGVTGALLSMGFRATRFDAAVDLVGDWGGLLDAVHAACERGELCGARTFGRDDRKSGGEFTGRMVTLGLRGSNGSGRFVRVYDKGLETGTAAVGYWVRWEAEFTDDVAARVCEAFACEAEPWEDVLRSHAMGAVDFRVSNGRKHVKDRPRAAWFAALVEGVKLRRVRAFRVSSSLWSWVRWAERCFAGQVVTFADRLGWPVDGFGQVLAPGGGLPRASCLASDVGRELVAGGLPELLAYQQGVGRERVA